MKTIKLAVLAVAAATTGLAFAGGIDRLGALQGSDNRAAVASMSDPRPQWEELRKSYEARQAALAANKTTGKKSVAGKAVPYDKSFAGQAEADRSTGPYHILEKHNP